MRFDLNIRRTYHEFDGKREAITQVHEAFRMY